MKNHPGKQPPPSARDKAAKDPATLGSNPTYSATVGSVTSQPHNCPFCHKQYATNAKLLQHQRKEHHGDHNYNQKRSQLLAEAVEAGGQILPEAAAAAAASQVVETGGQGSGLLVTVSGEEIGHFIPPQNQPGPSAASITNQMSSSQPPEWRTSTASNATSASEQQPSTASIHAAELIVGDDKAVQQVQQAPSSLEYRIDGEVLQLTRVPQAEAMRLVNSGATVIHVADPQQDSNLHSNLFCFHPVSL